MKKTIAIGFTIMTALSVFFIIDSNLELESSVLAESVDTSATVGNSPPIFSVNPTYVHDQGTGQWVNEGSNITFSATATEPNSQGYYLAVCLGPVTPGTAGGAPTCTNKAFCVSALTNSAFQSSCSEVIDGTFYLISNWSAYVCDNDNSSECSNAYTGNLYVNHVPTFTGVTDNGGGGINSGANPGGTMTFNATASDSDDVGLPDTVRIVVCADTAGATSAGCIGTQLCRSNLYSSNPYCSYTIPSVLQDGSYNYYAYVFDRLGQLGSNSNYRSGEYVVNNVAPVVSTVTLNGGADINLTERSTTNIIVTATVTDNNSCQDLSTIETSVYRSGITYALCDNNAEDDENNCYAQVICSVVGGTCTSSTDATANYSCTVPIKFHADATVEISEYPLEKWLSTVKARDNNSATGSTEIATGVEMNTLTALDISEASNPLVYGNLNVGDISNQADLYVLASGNVGLDLELSGSDLSDENTGTIPVSSQRYSLSSFDYQSGTELTVTPTELEFNLFKTTLSLYGNISNGAARFKIEIPNDTPPGAFSGSMNVTAVMSEVEEWIP